MKKQIIIGSLLLASSIPAHAIVGFALGTAVGSSMANSEPKSTTKVDMQKPTVICMANYFRQVEKELCVADHSLIPLGAYVAKMGYKHYQKRELVFANTNYYLVLDVWN